MHQLFVHFLKKSNFSRKKLQLIALQCDSELRALYTSDVLLHDKYSFIFVDETGCDRRDAIRKYGYCDGPSYFSPRNPRAGSVPTKL